MVRLIIEDDVVQGGKAAGMPAFGFVGGSHCDNEQGTRFENAGAEIIFTDMRELPSLIDEFCKSLLKG